MIPPRTLHVITDRDRRGAQVHAVDLAAGINAADGIAEVVALAPGTHGDLLALETLGSTRLSTTTLRNLRRRSADFDVVVAHGSSTLAACALALPGTAPFVYRQISDPLFWASTRSRRLRTGILMRRPRHVVALSDSVGDVFAAHYRLRRSSITTIPNAVPAALWPLPSRAEQVQARQAFDLPVDSTVAVSLGALVKEKGVDVAVHAIASREDAALIIAGDGPERHSLEQLATAIAPGRVRFLGPTDQPRTVLLAADLLLLASQGGDSMPAVLIEAGLCSLPSVTTPVGAIADVVVDQETGILAPVGDDHAFIEATCQLIDDAVKRRGLGSAARTRCERLFTIDAVIPAWNRLLESVADQ